MALEWVSASASSAGRAKTWSIRCSRSPPAWSAAAPGSIAALMDTVEQPPIADREGPFPHFPPRRRAIGREEQELCLADQVLRRDEPDHRRHAAILRIVAVVPHREIITLRHLVDRGV